VIDIVHTPFRSRWNWSGAYDEQSNASIPDESLRRERADQRVGCAYYLSRRCGGEGHAIEPFNRFRKLLNLIIRRKRYASSPTESADLCAQASPLDEALVDLLEYGPFSLVIISPEPSRIEFLFDSQQLAPLLPENETQDPALLRRRKDDLGCPCHL
jgi:hypothetical protein